VNQDKSEKEKKKKKKKKSDEEFKSPEGALTGVGLNKIGLDANRFAFTVRANDRKKLYWDIVILMFAIFNSVFIPLSLSFEQIEEELNNIPFYVFLDNAANLFFILDIIV